MSIWDNDDLFNDSEFFTFDEIGDEIEGVLTAIGTKTFEADKPGEADQVVPQLTFETDEGAEVIVTAGQIDLKKKLRKERPAVGDRVRIAHTGKKGRMKLFSVKVTRGEASPGF